MYTTFSEYHCFRHDEKRYATGGRILSNAFEIATLHFICNDRIMNTFIWIRMRYDMVEDDEVMMITIQEEDREGK